jgi:hypothetical protein
MVSAGSSTEKGYPSGSGWLVKPISAERFRRLSNAIAQQRTTPTIFG